MTILTDLDAANLMIESLEKELIEANKCISGLMSGMNLHIYRGSIMKCQGRLALSEEALRVADATFNELAKVSENKFIADRIPKTVHNITKAVSEYHAARAKMEEK